MFRKVFLSLSAIACLAGKASAQLQPCSSDEHHEHLLKTYPQLAEFEKQFDEQVAAKLAAKVTATGYDDTTWYDVPLVVHVVHDYGIENLSDNDIYEAAQNWALAFVKKNPDTAAVIAPFIPYIGNARMRLHLATIDPNGNPTKGIVRHHSYLTYTAADEAKYQSWPNNKYINIWFISSFGSSGAAAYAYYPSSGAFMPHYDGIISLASYLNTSKTIPHELGHVLNLPHVWGNNNNAAVACGNDGVDDTPPTKGHTPGCVVSAIFDTTCATGYVKTYTSALSGIADSVVDYPDTTNAQNIMDYTYCSNMFTKGQCARMRTALTNNVAGRNNLYTPANLAATGALAHMPDLPPVADFVVTRAEATGIVTDTRSHFLTFNNEGRFTFRNASWNDTITSVNWQFSNGATSPTSASTALVANKFSIPGWVSVSLTATSNAGSHTVIDDHAVYVADTTPAGGMGFTQPFSSPGAIYNWPMINYYHNQFRWEHYQGAGVGDNTCIRYRSFDTSEKIYGTAKGDYDDFVTPAFNLEGVTGDVFLNFLSAGMATSASANASRDSLEVSVSTTGGLRWTRIGGLRGTECANNGARNAEFIPGTSTTWAARAFQVPAANRSRQTFFRVRYRPGDNGNNLYLDNMAISNVPADIQDLSATGSNFVIYPNPSSSGCDVAFHSGNDGVVKYTIRDIAGKVVFEGGRSVTPNAIVTEHIERAATPVPGMYFITLTTGGATITAKMMVH